LRRSLDQCVRAALTSSLLVLFLTRPTTSTTETVGVGTR
jgi:hypothetical protein